MVGNSNINSRSSNDNNNNKNKWLFIEKGCFFLISMTLDCVKGKIFSHYYEVQTRLTPRNFSAYFSLQS